jgi:hypothetical protein
MSSRSGVKTRQRSPDLVEPQHLWVPPRRGSYGDEAADLIADCGRPLDPEQRADVDAQLSYGPGGRWVALESAIIEPRQNGKTGGELVPATLFDFFLLKPDRIVWTAHLFRTARDAFMDFVSLIYATAFLSRRVKKISYANGEESIELHSGAKLEFLARSKGGGRGLGGKRVVMDEALFLEADAMAALLPTLSARSITGDPHIMYASSAGLATSSHLRLLRDRGRRGGDPSLIWVERCASGSWEDPACEQGTECGHQVGTPGCALDNEKFWRQANHALDRRISVEYIRSERRALEPRDFGRERLGWWDDPALLLSVFRSGAWDLCGTVAPPPNPAALGIASDLDQVWLSLGAASNGEIPHVGSVLRIRTDQGRDTFVAEVKRIQDEHQCAVAIDVKGPASFLVEDLVDADVDLTRTGLEDLMQACADMKSAVEERAVTHGNYTDLNAAVDAAGWRTVGDRRVFARKNGDISMLEAVTLALWEASHDLDYDLMESFA